MITCSRLCLPGFSSVKLLSLPFCILLFGSKLLSVAHTQGKWRELSSLSWRRNICLNYLEFSVWEIVSCVPLIYSNHLFILVLTHRFYFVSQIVPALAPGGISHRFLCSSDSPQVPVLLFFEYFLIFWHYQMLQARLTYTLLQL